MTWFGRCSAGLPTFERDARQLSNFGKAGRRSAEEGQACRVRSETTRGTYIRPVSKTISVQAVASLPTTPTPFFRVRFECVFAFFEMARVVPTLQHRNPNWLQQLASVWETCSVNGRNSFAEVVGRSPAGPELLLSATGRRRLNRSKFQPGPCDAIVFRSKFESDKLPTADSPHVTRIG